MSDATPIPASSAMPLFPLQTVFFPGGLLTLRIFEVRYLEMIARRHREGEPFGVVCLSEGSEVRRPAAAGAHAAPRGDGFAHEAFYPVGTLARIVELERPQAGLLLIRCLGTQRFRLQRSEQQKFGLWVGDAELLADDLPVPVPDDLGFARDALRSLLRQIENSIEHSRETGHEMPLHGPCRWDDCGWLANRWCEMLPLAPVVKQRLLALDNPVLRLELVADTLGQWGLAGAR